MVHQVRTKSVGLRVIHIEIYFYTREISDDSIAWNLTQGIGYADEARDKAKSVLAAMKTNRSAGPVNEPPSRRRTGDRTTKSLRTSETGMPCSAPSRPTGERPETESDSELSDLTESESENDLHSAPMVASDTHAKHGSPGGPQAILFDCWRLKSWHLITHGGFFSHRHHDAGGLCTWMTIRSGLKIWGYLNVRVGSSVKQRNFITAKHNLMAGTPDDMRYLTAAEARNLVLVAGMVL